MAILSRALQASATQAQKESQVPLGRLAPQALQGLYNIRKAATIDQLKEPVSRDHQALMESQLVHYKLPLKWEQRGLDSDVWLIFLPIGWSWWGRKACK